MRHKRGLTPGIGRTELGLVEVYRLAGRTDDAIRALDDAIARFEQKGNVVMTERSRALRDELSATNR